MSVLFPGCSLLLEGVRDSSCESWQRWTLMEIMENWLFFAALLLSLSGTEKFNYIISGLLSMTFDMVCFSILLQQQIPEIYSPLDSFIPSKWFHANFMESPFAFELQNSLPLETHRLIAFTCPIFTTTHLEGYRTELHIMVIEIKVLWI